MALKIVFMGTPDFAVPALQALINSEHEIVAAYSQPPRPAGRGMKLTPSSIHSLAEQHNIEVRTPLNFKNADDVKALKALGADIAIVVAYGLLLPKSVLEAFPKGCINIHPSALPRWRGAAPLQRTVLAGDKTTDICIMQMDEGLDTGAVLKRQSFDLPENITSGALHDWLSQESAPILLSCLAEIESGKTQPIPQSVDDVTYAKKILKEEARIVWGFSSNKINNKIRGLNPFPHASAEINGEVIKILEAEKVDTKHGAESGTLLDDALLVACGEGALRLTRLQRAGKKPMSAHEFLQGFSIKSGDRFN